MMREGWLRAAGVVGTLGLCAGLLLFFYDGELSGRALALAAVGIAGLSLWIIFAPDDLRGWISGRQAAAGTTSVIVTILFASVIMVIYVQAARQNATVDFTSDERYTLSPPSLNVIRQVQALGRPIRLVGFYPRSMLREREAADIILRQYDAEGGDLIEVRYVDPDEEPLVARAYAYNALESKQDAIFVSFVLPNGEPDTPSIRYVGSLDERQISTTIFNLITVTQTKFYFTTGHGELDIASQAGTGLNRAAGVLEDLFNIQVGTVNLLTDNIPEDANALIIAGPASPFDQTEVDKIAAFVGAGGRLMIMANPPYVDATFGGTSVPVMQDSALGKYLWETFGVRFRDDLIVDEASSFDTAFNPIPAAYNASHEIMRDFGANTAIVFSLARSIELVEAASGGQSAFIRQPLMFSSEDAYGERTLQTIQAGTLTEFDPQTDVQGPLVIAASVRGANELVNEDTTRLVLVGDIDWLTNDFVVRFDGNALLWAAAAQWLGGTAEMTLIDPAIQRDILPITATEQERQRVSVVTTLVMPLLVLLVGAGVWFWRRRG